MSSPTVTVLVPTIGRPEYLRRTLDSLSRQTLRDFDVIILDNATDAPTQQVAQEFVRREARARVSRVDHRIPAFHNFNRGFAAATGEFVTLFHDDDVYSPTFLATMVGHMRRHRTAGFAGSNYDIIDADERVTGQRRHIHATRVVHGQKYIENVLRMGRGRMATQSLFFRRSMLPDDYIDLSLSINWGDFVFLMRMAETCDVLEVESPLVKVRVHAGAASSALDLVTALDIRTRVFNAYIDELSRRAFVPPRVTDQYRTLVRTAHIRGLLYGWLSADSIETALMLRQKLQEIGATMLAGLLRLCETKAVNTVKLRAIWPLVTHARRLLAR